MKPIGKPGHFTRRHLVLGAPALILGSSLSRTASALAPTPRQSEGPFYPLILPDDSDADLTIFDGERVPGEVIEVVGRLFAPNGDPMPRGEIEIWHCDANGVYAHVGEPANVDDRQVEAPAVLGDRQVDAVGMNMLPHERRGLILATSQIKLATAGHTTLWDAVPKSEHPHNHRRSGVRENRIGERRLLALSLPAGQSSSCRCLGSLSL